MPATDGERNDVAPLGERNGASARACGCHAPRVGRGRRHRTSRRRRRCRPPGQDRRDGRRALGSDRGDRRTRGHQHGCDTPVEQFAGAVGRITIRPDPGEVVVGAPEQRAGGNPAVEPRIPVPTAERFDDLGPDVRIKRHDAVDRLGDLGEHRRSRLAEDPERAAVQQVRPTPEQAGSGISTNRSAVPSP